MRQRKRTPYHQRCSAVAGAYPRGRGSSGYWLRPPPTADELQEEDKKRAQLAREKYKATRLRNLQMKRDEEAAVLTDAV